MMRQMTLLYLYISINLSIYPVYMSYVEQCKTIYKQYIKQHIKNGYVNKKHKMHLYADLSEVIVCYEGIVEGNACWV